MDGFAIYYECNNNKNAIGCTAVFCGSDEHIGTCSICGNTSGPMPCMYVNNTCRICGHCNSHIDLDGVSLNVIKD